MSSEAEQTILQIMGVTNAQHARARLRRADAAHKAGAPTTMFPTTTDDGDDPEDPERDIAAGRDCIAAHDAATSDQDRVEHLANAGKLFSSASKKLAAKSADGAHVRFSK